VRFRFMLGECRAAHAGCALAPAHEISLHIGGHGYGVIGAGKFALVSVANDPVNLAMFLFAAMFMDTARHNSHGRHVRTLEIPAFLVYGLFMSMFLYPLYGNWVWVRRLAAQMARLDSGMATWISPARRWCI